MTNITTTADGINDIEMTTRIVAVVVVLTAIITIAAVMSVGLSCWCYYLNKRERDLTTKGGLIFLNNDLKRACSEGQLVVNVSLLDHTKHSEENVCGDLEFKHQSGDSVREKRPKPASEKQPSNSIPMTEDGYATLEPESTQSVGNYQPQGHVLPRSQTSEYDHLQTVQSVSNEEDGTNVNENDYEELFWEPANQEEELMVQLSKLGLPVILSENIELNDCLGSGEFGAVHRGLWTLRRSDGICLETKKIIEVAVKSIKEAASEGIRVKFLQEAAIMGQFKHPNILRVLGIVFEEPMKLVIEIMPKGDLLHHLISLRPVEGQSQCKELGALLLSYTRQIALGMSYLSIKEYVHRDLAARNVLVSDDDVCKIADFGLSRNLQQENYYVSQGGKIPVKWTAPEALHYHKYSIASDVWSYGCLLYEIWSLGCKPFNDVTNAEVMQKVLTGYRLPPPPGCPRNIYKIMIECWNPTPMLRPKFCHMLVSLQQPDFRILKWSEEDLAACNSEKAKVLGSPIDDGFCLYKDLQSAYSAVDYETDSNKQTESF